MASLNINKHTPFGFSIFEMVLPQFEEHQGKLADFILTARDSNRGLYRSNNGGWHSSNKLHLDEGPSVKWLIRELYKIGQLCVFQEQRIPNNHRLVISACWANINESGDWNAPHAHQPAEWAGVCYINICDSPEEKRKSEQDGNIIFINPLPFGPHYDRSPTISYKPTVGSVFIFPGYLLHMVAPHFSDQPRISVAFNLRFSPIKDNECNEFYLSGDREL